MTADSWCRAALFAFATYGAVSAAEDYGGRAVGMAVWAFLAAVWIVGTTARAILWIRDKRSSVPLRRGEGV